MLVAFWQVKSRLSPLPSLDPLPGSASHWDKPKYSVLIFPGLILSIVGPRRSRRPLRRPSSPAEWQGKPEKRCQLVSRWECIL